MKTVQDLKRKLKEIDHKSYSLYKELKGAYVFDGFVLMIDKVQGDPFASPSRVRVVLSEQEHGFQKKIRETPWTQRSLEDTILRTWNRVMAGKQQKSGSGNSGKIGVCPCGQEILKRHAVEFTKENTLEGSFLVGFPAKGRSILAGELEKVLCEMVPDMVTKVFQAKSYDAGKLEEQYKKANQRKKLRDALTEKHLVGFIENGAILPRESGVSQRPLKDAIPFESPKTLEVSIDVGDGVTLKGMGIPEGITVIVGGGYHGKSTLLEAIQLGVYDHILGDGREFVVTKEDAVKVRAEDGRNICGTDIQMFINHLPNNKDTKHFYSENASGSTSQASNTVEAMEAGTSVLLIDEDTSATNFMVRDGLMEKIVPKGMEPITPFISWIRALYEEKGISTVIVVGSSAAYLEVADVILQLDNYKVKDITKEAKAILSQHEATCLQQEKNIPRIDFNRIPEKIDMSYKGRDMKVKTTGTDTIMLNHEVIDVRYLEQMVDWGQTTGVAYILKYLLEKKVDHKQTMKELVDDIYCQIEKQGFSSVIPGGYSAGFPVLPRKMEVLAAWNRFRKLKLKSVK